MIYAKISDGFGNQLFMYACCYAVARRLNTKLLLDISYIETNNLRSYELDKLNIVYDKIFKTTFLKYYPLKVLYRKLFHCYIRLFKNIYKEKIVKEFDPAVLYLRDETYLSGYWQNENYFKDFRKDLLQMISPRNNVSAGCREWISKVNGCNSVAVHIRRGDYVKLGICLNVEYYKRAVEYIIASRQEAPRFFVFSDDIEYSKIMMSGICDAEYVQYATIDGTLEDFFIMKECNHIIMANSSYSWWAAWLNDNPFKIVICSMDTGSTLSYPEGWVKL